MNDLEHPFLPQIDYLMMQDIILKLLDLKKKKNNQIDSLPCNNKKSSSEPRVQCSVYKFLDKFISRNLRHQLTKKVHMS